MTRPLKDIDAEINATADKLTALYEERRQFMRDRIDVICRAHDRGLAVKQIAEDMGMLEVAVRSLLWRAGRTKTGRKNVKRRLREASSPHGAAAPNTQEMSNG